MTGRPTRRGRGRLYPFRHLIAREATVTAGYTICPVCGWEVSSRNAVGLAAQHAYETGHPLEASQTVRVAYRRRR